MSVIIINPNSTRSMTDAMLRVARDAAPETAFEGWTSHTAPAAIQGREDGNLATPPLLELVHAAEDCLAQGIIIGCFDDTGLTEAAEIATCPVVGIGQAAFHFAALRNWRFSVVTTLAVSVPVIEENIKALGLERFVGRVRASNVPVLDLERNPDAARSAVIEEARLAASEDGADAIVLGCAGMVDLPAAVRQATGLAVLDPVRIAARSMQWLRQA